MPISAWIARSRSTTSWTDASGVSASGEAAATCMAICLPSAVELVALSAVDLSATSTPILPSSGDDGVVDVGRDDARIDTDSAIVRRTLMFSPILAISSVKRLLDAGIARSGASAASRDRRLRSSASLRGALARSPGTRRCARRNRSRQFTSTSAPSSLADRNADQGLRRRCGRPSSRPWRGPSCAASRWRLPCRRWFRQAPLLQSIMPAPVLSRRSFTMPAVILAMSCLRCIA